MRSLLFANISLLAMAWASEAPLAQDAPPQPRTVAFQPGVIKVLPRTSEAEPDRNFRDDLRLRYLLLRGKQDPAARIKAWAHARQMQPYRFDPKDQGVDSPLTLKTNDGRRPGRSYPPGSPNGPGGMGGGPAGGPGTPGTTDMQGCAWVSRGPTNINGRVTSIAVDPNNANHVFATGVGGIWRSLDRARTWERVSDDFLASVFSAVAVNPNDGTEVIAGGGDADYQGSSGASGLGIWRSTSSGAATTWSKISPPELDGQVIYRLRYDTAAPYNVYAATSTGVYLGVRSGGNITFSRLGGFDAEANDLVVDTSTTPHKVYVGVRNGSATYAKGIWVYNGATWTKRDTGIPTGDWNTIALALAQSAPATLYAKIARASNGNLLDVYKTTSAALPLSPGVNAWTPLGTTPSDLDDSHFNATGGYSWYNSLIEVDPTNPNIVWSAGTSLYRSTSGGAAGSWVNVNTGVGPAAEGVHGDHHALAFDPTNPKIVYDGDDGGMYRSSDSSAANWTWAHVSHNMTSTQFYRSTTQWAPVSFLAGGFQDNGTEITFGGRTWLQPGGCDGADVGLDAHDASTLYSNCNGGLYELVNPVPGTPGGGSTAAWTLPSGISNAPPVATDYSTAGAALMAGQRAIPPATPGGTPPWAPRRLLKTTDGLNFASITTELPTGSVFTALAIAPSSSFQTYYVGVSDAGSGAPGIWRSTTGGASWVKPATGLPGAPPTGVAVDYSNPARAFATFGGGTVAITTDTGASWTAINGTGASGLPPTANFTSVAIDPFHSNVIYVGSDVGMFRGVVTTPVSGPSTAAWTTFNEGLPDGLDVTSVMADPVTGFLSIGSFGWAAYDRDVNPGDMCPTHFAYLRDNTEDRGYLPSPSGVADPEWPVPDPARPGFYKPDDSPGGQLYWWTSADVKIDVPHNDPALNTLSAVDHVEFESCPTRESACPANQLLDSSPERGRPARVFVQVQNRGTQAAHNVRVMALYADATTGLPLLPTDFWTTSFPAGGGACGPISGTDWRNPDPSHACKTIAEIRPDRPEVVEFDWNVSPSQADHSCMLVLIESTEQPLDASIRSSNERELWVLVPGSSQIANRNLHVVDSTSPGGTAGGSEGMGVPNPTRSDKPIELVVAKSGLFKDGSLILVLPPEAKAAAAQMERAANATSAVVPAFKHVKLADTADTRRLIVENHLDPSLAFEVSAADSAFPLAIPPGAKWKIGLVYDSGHGKPNTAARFTILARQGTTVLGGSTYLLRISPHPHP